MLESAMIALLAVVLGSTKIFDGKSLAGWSIVGGGKWVAEKGVLRGSCAKADDQGILLYEKPVGDFTAKLKFRISGGNSGFYFRCETLKEQPLMRGMQAEIDAIDDVAGIWETAGRGWVYKPTPEVHATTKFVPGEWSSMDVSAIGTHYVVKLNGKTVTDIDDPMGRKEGAVGLQLHGGMDMVVEFKDVYLNPMKK
jgi:hypothetical protein